MILGHLGYSAVTYMYLIMILRTYPFIISKLLIKLHLLRNTPRTSTNSEDLDEMPNNAAFHHGLHCLLRKQSKRTAKIKTL